MATAKKKASTAKKSSPPNKSALTSKTNTRPSAASGNRLQAVSGKSNKLSTKKETKKMSNTETKAEKPAKKSARALYQENTITKHAETNPKRGKAKERFDLYEDGMTVAEYIEKGGLLRDVKVDVDLKHIKLHKPTAE